VWIVDWVMQGRVRPVSKGMFGQGRVFKARQSTLRLTKVMKAGLG